MNFADNKTFILAFLGMVLSFAGVYLNMFAPDVFTACLTACISGYTVRTVAKKWTDSYKEKLKNGGKK